MIQIKERLLKINKFSRPGWKMKEVKGFVYHWIGNTMTTNKQLLSYFQSLGNQKTGKENPRYASSHLGLDLKGNVIRLIPDNEVAFHAGAWNFTDLAKKDLGEYYTSNKPGHTPNYCLIGCEMSHMNYGKCFTWDQIRSAIKLGASYCLKYNLDPITQVYRHYDITGKECPGYFVDNPKEWIEFKELIKREMEKWKS